MQRVVLPISSSQSDHAGYRDWRCQLSRFDQAFRREHLDDFPDGSAAGTIDGSQITLARQEAASRIEAVDDGLTQAVDDSSLNAAGFQANSISVRAAVPKRNDGFGGDK